MKRDSYEIYLLELRQGLKEAEKLLKTNACVELLRFQKLIKLKTLVQDELVNYRMGSVEPNKALVNFMEG